MLMLNVLSFATANSACVRVNVQLIVPFPSPGISARAQSISRVTKSLRTKRLSQYMYMYMQRKSEGRFPSSKLSISAAGGHRLVKHARTRRGHRSHLVTDTSSFSDSGSASHNKVCIYILARRESCVGKEIHHFVCRDGRTSGGPLPTTMCGRLGQCSSRGTAASSLPNITTRPSEICLRRRIEQARCVPRRRRRVGATRSSAAR